MKILLFTSIIFIIIAINLIISCSTKEGMSIGAMKETVEEIDDAVKKNEKEYIFTKKNYTDDGNPSQKFLKTFKRQKIEFDGEFTLKSITPEIPDSEQEAKKMQAERDAKKEERDAMKKESERQAERELNRREDQARKFCISVIPKTLWKWITEPFREIYYFIVNKLGMKWIGKCIEAKKFIFGKIWEIKKSIISGFWNVMIDIIMFPCRKLGLDKAYRPLWQAKVDTYNSIIAPIVELLTWKKNKILRALRFIC